MSTRYNDCVKAQNDAIREILITVEAVILKYNIHPDDYHKIRSKTKSKIIRLTNVWHKYFATVVDAKYIKKVNEMGELEETHCKNG